MIIIKFAQNNLGYIGLDNGIPWKCSQDLKDFKKATEGNVVIMGRKTWLSLGRKPLPNRANFVVSLDDEYVGKMNEKNKHDNVFFFNSLDKALDISNKFYQSNPTYKSKDQYIIGGAMLIESAIRELKGKIDKMEISVIDNEIVGDTMVNQELLETYNIPIVRTIYK